MPIPKNKQELLSAVQLTYSKLQKDLENIPIEAANRVELEGHAKGTSMSICNLVAYLIGWGELVLKWQRNKSKGEVVDFPETDYKWNELGRLAQKFYADYEDLDYPTLLTKLEGVVGEITALIEGLDNTELYEKAWYDKWTIGRMIQLNTSSPYKNARARVRKWKKLNGIK